MGSQSLYNSRDEDQFRRQAYTFAYTNSPRLTAILEVMRAAIPALNTDGIRLNIRPEHIHEDDLRGSIYAVLLGNRRLLIGASDEEIFCAACQAYLDNIIFPGL
jgi:hypothetical protein